MVDPLAMPVPTDTSQPCFSARLILPFVRLLRREPSFPPQALEGLADVDPDARIPIAIVQELLTGALYLTSDEDLGLKAAREIVPGDYGAVEYAARSAATWGEAANAVGRYMRLINDALQFSLTCEGERAFVHLDSQVPLLRASADFQSAAFHVSAMRFWPFQNPEFEVWFTHAAPANSLEYERTFPGARRLRFEAPFNGFTFPSEYIDLPMPGADPALHALITKHAAAMLAELPSAQNLTARVRDLLAKELAGGTPSLTHVARRLGMSERTLERHLEEEGTAFKLQLEDLRRRLALRYVRRSELPFSGVAVLLGFSQAAAFHRAFRRWTGQTPLEYRKAVLVPADPSSD
jgi:AraC-like DNA-binding protein